MSVASVFVNHHLNDVRYVNGISLAKIPR